MEPTIRDIEPDDYPAVCRLLQQELGYGDVSLSSLKCQLVAMDLSPDYRTLVAVRDGETVGFVGLCRMVAFELEGPYLRVIALAVRGDAQGRGIGTALMNRVESLAREWGAISIGLNSGLARESAHRFYESLGYHKKGYAFCKDL